MRGNAPKMKRIFALMLFVFALQGCEKDDICDPDTNTTPRLVISFFDYNNPTLAKNVTNLKVVAEGREDGIVFNETAADNTRYLTSANKIFVPLDISADRIRYILTLNANASDPGLVYTDTLEFNYTRQTLYISRACGYSVYFTLNNGAGDESNPFVLNNDESATQGSWIQNITLANRNLISEDDTHLNIYW